MAPQNEAPIQSPATIATIPISVELVAELVERRSQRLLLGRGKQLAEVAEDRRLDVGALQQLAGDEQQQQREREDREHQVVGDHRRHPGDVLLVCAPPEGGDRSVGSLPQRRSTASAQGRRGAAGDPQPERRGAARDRDPAAREALEVGRGRVLGGSLGLPPRRGRRRLARLRRRLLFAAARPLPGLRRGLRTAGRFFGRLPRTPACGGGSSPASLGSPAPASGSLSVPLMGAISPGLQDGRAAGPQLPPHSAALFGCNRVGMPV